MNYLLAALFFLILLLVLALLLMRQKQHLGSLTHHYLYLDTDSKKGQLLYSTSIPLVGKPDYLVRVGESVIPVEVKTGSTPKTPKHHHVMQLLAYCYLVEENYGIVPPRGILKYPQTEFKIAYDSHARDLIKKTVSEILNLKKFNREIHCRHPFHYSN